MTIDELRKSGLTKKSLLSDPFKQFDEWYRAATKAGTSFPETMTLATANEMGKPSARMVLLRGFDEKGFCFYTNYNSRKGSELSVNPYAALVFYWPLSERQVRLEGKVEKLSPAESDAYFDSRPRGSRLGAHASPQSLSIENRSTLEKSLERFQAALHGQDVPRPDTWGGYRLMPVRFEFWQAGEHRLHDRFVYLKLADTRWRIQRLAP